MKVLLINPPYPFEESPTPPFGLMSLAAYLIEKGIEVRIADFIITRFSEDKARAIIDDFNPDVIGATGVTMNIKKAFSILQFFKELKPEAVFVMGGPHVTFDADTVLRENSFLDYIVRGEGEVTCTELLRAIQNNTSPEGILGISYRNGNEIIHNDRRPFIEDINTLPFPARHLVSLTKYRALRFPINMVTSRGCPHQCIFCLGSKMVGRKVRYFDTMRIVDEFEMLSKMGFSQINIVDDLFTSNKKRCIEFCDEIMRRGIQHKWTAFARVDTVSLELLQAMQKAGCTTLCFGIESGNQEIL
nr:radical SAM protein [Spirochaetota bacterium]